MKVLTLDGLESRPGKLTSRYRDCKTITAYSPVLDKEVVVCADENVDRPAKRPRRRRNKNNPECKEFGWTQSRNGRWMCRCRTPGNNKLQPHSRCPVRGEE